MKSQLASLILFASILSIVSLQEFKTTGLGLALENDREISSLARFNKSTSKHQPIISQIGWRGQKW
jgi:hypothetical protein